MFSEVATAMAFPAGLMAVLVPPLVQWNAQLSLSSTWMRGSWLKFSSDSDRNAILRRHVGSTIDAVLPLRQQKWVQYYDDAFPGLFAALGFALLAIWATSLAIRNTRDVFFARGFKGRDLLKASSHAIPESAGLPAAGVYMLLLFLFIPFRYFNPHLAGAAAQMDGRGGFPHHELASFLSALLSFASAILLGFLDDVFDIRWRYKLPIPIIASFPLLMVYYAGGGGTSVVVPGFPAVLRNTLGRKVVELGPLYYVYMSLLSTFCTNSINILAGINGVEVGQALVICVSLCINDALYLDARAGRPGSRSSEELLRRHLLSLYLLLPLAGVCIGLLAWNRYPSRVFVGDTFCYFAGMVFSTVGILGHFSKTVLLFFTPQIFNFLLSCPQLFGLVPNPRHRVPRFHPSTNALYPSIQYFAHPADNNNPESKTLPNTSGKPLRPASTLTLLTLRLLQALRLVQLDFYDDDRKVVKSTTNLTLLNAILLIRGVRCCASADTDPSLIPFTGPRISELNLWTHTMLIQVAGSCLAFAIRYWVAAIVFP